MNGQMYQVCCIVVAAKSALQKHKALVFTPMRYENKTEFQFLPLLPQNGQPEEKTHIASSVADWYDCCTKKGLQDIKLIAPTSVDERGLLGFSNTTQSLLVCFYQTQVTYFTAHWEFDSEKQLWNILYTEHEWKNAPSVKPRFKDESANFMKVLANIKELACKIDCDEFAGVFQRAIDVLKGTSSDIDPAYKLSLSALPEKHLRIFEAASTADVFGAMGSWNDSPAGMAVHKNLYKEYNELSDELLKQMRLSILYAINEW